jgi:hypothetical protein
MHAEAKEERESKQVYGGGGDYPDGGSNPYGDYYPGGGPGGYRGPGGGRGRRYRGRRCFRPDEIPASPELQN